eukprot:tig00000189_g14306.t1
MPMPNAPEDRATSTFIDGACVCNNPTLAAWLEVSKMYPGRDILMVSLGSGSCGTPFSRRDAEKFTLLHWASKSVDCILDGTADSINQVAGELLGENVSATEARTKLLAEDPEALRPIRPAEPSAPGKSVRKPNMVVIAKEDLDAALGAAVDRETGAPPFFL